LLFFVFFVPFVVKAVVAFGEGRCRDMSDGPSKNVRRVLLVSTNQLGDCIAFLPVAAAVRKHLPDARITMLTRRIAAEAAALTGCVDEFIVASSARRCIVRNVSLLKCARTLRKAPFDLAFMASGESSATVAMLKLGRVRKRIGFADCRLRRLLSIQVEAHEPELEARRNLRLLRAAGLPDALERPPFRIPGPRLAEAQALIAKSGPRPGPRVLIHPGSSQPTRRWPVANFAELCSRLFRSGLAQPVLVEGPAEPGVAAEIRRISARPLLVLSQLKGIDLLAAVMAQCDLFVGHSSGPFHLAVLLGRPTVSLWGDTDPRLWGPAWESERHVLVRSPLPCAGCEHWDPKRHAVVRGPKEGAAGDRAPCERCFDAIMVDDVFEAIRGQLAAHG
jgi:ADP-heptose:LPS heptosyltransferase